VMMARSAQQSRVSIAGCICCRIIFERTRWRYATAIGQRSGHKPFERRHQAVS
jgi:hypothetical protein